MGDKRNITDFALWKFSPKDQQRQMEWESPWGTGFPGWHIECSAMSLAYLPQPVDIHCGGADHIRVHHTNEIAQTEAATGKQFVKYWLHGEFLVLGKDKMAKSGGTFMTMDTLREKNIDPLAYRMFCYTAHYRTPLSFSWEGLHSSAQSLSNLRRTVAQLRAKTENVTVADAETDSVLEPFFEALCDDLNVPRALATLWEFVRNESLPPALRLRSVEKADDILGLDLLIEQADQVQSCKGEDGVTVYFECPVEVPADVQTRLAAVLSDRRKARRDKDYATADGIRDRLNGLGVEVKDQSDGSTLVVVPPSACNSEVLQEV
jgi:cysteinyl-tRNA synthetase